MIMDFQDKFKKMLQLFVEHQFIWLHKLLLKKSYDQKVDLWRLGIMIYYMHFQQYEFPNSFNDNDEIKKCFNKKKKKILNINY